MSAKSLKSWVLLTLFCLSALISLNNISKIAKELDFVTKKAIDTHATYTLTYAEYLINSS